MSRVRLRQTDFVPSEECYASSSNTEDDAAPESPTSLPAPEPATPPGMTPRNQQVGDDSSQAQKRLSAQIIFTNGDDYFEMRKKEKVEKQQREEERDESSKELEEAPPPSENPSEGELGKDQKVGKRENTSRHFKKKSIDVGRAIKRQSREFAFGVVSFFKKDGSAEKVSDESVIINPVYDKDAAEQVKRDRDRIKRKRPGK